jgi:hypothetical protein
MRIRISWKAPRAIWIDPLHKAQFLLSASVERQ